MIGRAPGFADWVLPHTDLSRQHAEVRREGGVVYVRDLGSTNGTFLAGARLGTGRTILFPRKELAVGPYRLWLDFLRTATSAKTLRVKTQS